MEKIVFSEDTSENKYNKIDDSCYDAIAMAETAGIVITNEQAIEYSELRKQYGEYAPISDPLILYSLLNDEQRFLLSKIYSIEL